MKARATKRLPQGCAYCFVGRSRVQEAREPRLEADLITTPRGMGRGRQNLAAEVLKHHLCRGVKTSKSRAVSNSLDPLEG